MKASRHVSTGRLLAPAGASLLALAVAAGVSGAAATRTYSGTTGQGISVHFHTNAKVTKILPAMYMAIPNVLCLYQGQGAAQGAFPLRTSQAITVRKGRFSSTQPGQPDQYGTLTIKITGHFKSTKSTATVSWTLNPTGSAYECSPTSGSFTWTAYRTKGR